MVAADEVEAVPGLDTEDDNDDEDVVLDRGEPELDEAGNEVEVGDETDDDGLEGADEDGPDETGVETVETGQTVVETAMVDMTTVVESLGQLVTVGAQLTMV